MNAQTVLFEDSFETYDDFAIENIGDWTLVDVDGSSVYGFQGVSFPNSGVPKAYIVFNSTTTVPALTPSDTSDWSARTGSKAMASFASTTPTNNDWLISPQITLGSTGNELKFWAKAADATYGQEQFNVLISTSGTNTGDFTSIASVTINNIITWTEYTYGLDDYAGQSIYIAIQCVSDDQFGFLVDDFSITTTDSASIDTALAGSFSVYPNPAKDVLNISNSIGAEITAVTVSDINGRTVKQFGSVSQINISDLNAGVYFVNISSNEGSLTKKVVKQ